MKEKLAALRRINVKKAAAAVATLAVAAQASAASVLDTAAKAAITDGFTQMKDTALDVMTTSWPFLLSITAIMFAPKIVKRLANKI